MANLKQDSHSSHSFSTQELGVWIGMASFGMLFGTFLLSYLLARARFPTWPPVGVDPIPSALPSFSTLLLLASSFFAHRSLKYWDAGNVFQFKKIWLNAIILGFCFLLAQVTLWGQLIEQGLNAQDHLYGGAVYTLTGLHALHILGGLVSLIWVYFKAKTFQKNSQAPKLVSLFWHFLDAVWIAMFLIMVIL